VPDGNAKEIPRLDIEGQVRIASGPWRVETRWWEQSEHIDRDYWDVELTDGAIYRIYRDRKAQTWFADGVYD